MARITTPQEAKERGIPYPTTPSAEVEMDRGPGEGNFLLKLGLGKPTFTELKYFDVFYGKTQYMPTLGFNYYVLNTRFIAVGGGVELGFYSDSGHEVKHIDADDPQASELEKADGVVNLTLIPYRFLLTTQLRPFAGGTLFDFINFDLWLGYEELYFREMRTPKGTEVKPTATAQNRDIRRNNLAANHHGPNRQAAAASDGKLMMNRGWNAHSVVGAAINIRVNRLDEKSVRSLRPNFGISSVYVSPYFEVAMPLGGNLLTGRKASKPSYASRTYGLAFTFEGMM